MLKKIFTVCLLLLSASLLTGCAGTQTKGEDKNPDPLESSNRAFFTFNETLDKHMLKPVANTYVGLAPKPLREVITSFFDNVTYLNVILNSFLQGKFEQGMADTMRFLVNSTVGIGGLVDVATPMGLQASKEDLGQTLAAWGVGQGAYLYVPIRGPNTARNLPNLASSYLLNPLTYLTGTILFPVTALSVINRRANLLEATSFRDEAAIDTYSFTREAYLQQRQQLIHDGNPPIDEYDDIFGEEADDASILMLE